MLRPPLAQSPQAAAAGVVVESAVGDIAAAAPPSTTSPGPEATLADDSAAAASAGSSSRAKTGGDSDAAANGDEDTRAVRRASSFKVDESQLDGLLEGLNGHADEVTAQLAREKERRAKVNTPGAGCEVTLSPFANVCH